MGKFYEVKKVGEKLMESVTDLMDETVKASFGTLDSLAEIDPKTLEMIRKGKELMDLSMEYVKVSTEAFSNLEALEEANNKLLIEMRTRLQLLSEKK